MTKKFTPEWLEVFYRELRAGLQSQEFTDKVEVSVIFDSPRTLALVVASDGYPPEGVIRNIDHAISVDPKATLETVALDIAISDIAEPRPQGVSLSHPKLDQINQYWPGIIWTGDLETFTTH